MTAGLLTPAEFIAIRRHLESAFPEEGCGVLLETEGQRVVRRCRSIQNWMHDKDPDRYPPATHAYTVSPEDLAAIQWELDRGGHLLAIYHAHTHGIGAHLSRGDVQATLVDGTSQAPDTVQIVAAVRHGTLEEMRAFRWDPMHRSYLVIGLCVMRDGAVVQPRVMPLVQVG